MNSSSMGFFITSVDLRSQIQGTKVIPRSITWQNISQPARQIIRNGTMS
jgi:hypothetical protein